MIAVGAGEIADPLAELTANVQRHHLVLQLRRWLPTSCPTSSSPGDDGSEISYSAGVATGLLLEGQGAARQRP